MDCSVSAACVCSFKFLMLVEIVHSEDNIKEVEERLNYLLLFREQQKDISTANLQLTSITVARYSLITYETSTHYCGAINR